MENQLAIIAISAMVGLLAVASVVERINYRLDELKTLIIALSQPEIALVGTEPGDRPLAVCSHCGESLHFHTSSDRLVVECQACDAVLFRYYSQKRRAA